MTFLSFGTPGRGGYGRAFANYEFRFIMGALEKTAGPKARARHRPMPASILIADDYDGNRELLRLMLAADGHTIREARDGREAVASAREHAPDLALIDLSMPHLDGWGALRELRADPRTRAVPCVAVTAFASDEDRRRALEAGFDAYLAKPFRARDLTTMVERLLAEHRRAGEPSAL